MEPITDEGNNCSPVKNEIQAICVWWIPYWMLRQNPELEKMGIFFTTNQHAKPSSMKNICQTSDMILMENIYGSNAIQG